MSRKPLRTFICAATAAALGTFGTLAQATFYGGDFDPPTIIGHFTGHFIVNDVNDQCLQGNTEGCEIDLISLVISNSGHFGSGDFSTGQTHIASSASFDGGLHFMSVPIPLTVPLTVPLGDFAFAGFSSVAAVTCNPCVQFTTQFGEDFLQNPDHQGYLANLYNDPAAVADNAIYTAARIPEPGSLGLLVGGIGAAWLARRRRTRA